MKNEEYNRTNGKEYLNKAHTTHKAHTTRQASSTVHAYGIAIIILVAVFLGHYMTLSTSRAACIDPLTIIGND